MHSNHQTELHASQMTKHVADVEAELRQTQNEKQMVLDDLRAVRDLCAKLEMSKDSLQRQLTAKTLDIEKVSLGQDHLRDRG
jgi:septal ring factor EnvC (AmiA/AmiB activator)